MRLVKLRKNQSTNEQICKISREEPPHPLKQRRDELRKGNFFVSLPLWWRLLISVDSCAEWGWPETPGTIQGGGYSERMDGVSTGSVCYQQAYPV